MIQLNSIKSIIKFKHRLISDIPYTPNNNESKNYLLMWDIGDLIHIYDFCKERQIEPASRKVIVGNKVRNGNLYVRNRVKITNILDQVRKGIDINQYLSHSAHSGAFDVELFKKNRDFNSFRDQILICEGFFHLHLEKFPKRTDEILIVHVTPSTFEITQVAKHDLFDDNPEAFAEYQSHIDQFLHSKIPDGSYYIGGAGGGMQNLAGSSFQSTNNQIYAQKILQHVEIKCGGIDNYVKQLYLGLDGRNTKYVNPEWRMLQRELIIYDKKNKREFMSEHLAYHFFQSHG